VNGKVGALVLGSADVGAAPASDLTALASVVAEKAAASTVGALAAAVALKAEQSYVDDLLEGKASASSVSDLAAAVGGKVGADDTRLTDRRRIAEGLYGAFVVDGDTARLSPTYVPTVTTISALKALDGALFPR